MKLRHLFVLAMCVGAGTVSAVHAQFGQALQKPLALAVIGGLLLSTFLTLVLMPVLSSLLEPESPGD